MWRRQRHKHVRQVHGDERNHIRENNVRPEKGHLGHWTEDVENNECWICQLRFGHYSDMITHIDEHFN